MILIAAYDITKIAKEDSMLLGIENLKKEFLSLVYDYMGRTGVRIMDFLGSCLVAVLILVIGFKVSNYVVKLAKRVLERSRVDLMIQTFLLSCLKIGLKILVVFMAVTHVGVAASS